MISIILGPENLPEAIPYFCMKCRQRLFHGNRDILVIYFGMMYPPKEIPLGMGWINIRCHSCKQDWHFYYQ